MAQKSGEPASKNPAAQAPGKSGGKARAKVLAPAESSRVGTKGAKARAEVPTPDQRYEMARKAAEARVVRHGIQDKLREKA